MFQKPYAMKPIEEHFEGRYSLTEIRFALADVTHAELLGV
jgi:hypothetical protein